MTVFVWIFNGRGQLLLTKRSPEKMAYPNFWALTGGAALAGENGLQAVQRELFEETGIRAELSEFTLVDQYKRKNCLCDSYYLVKDVPLTELVMQPGETCDAKWVSRREFEAMIARKEIAEPDAVRYRQIGKLTHKYLK